LCPFKINSYCPILYGQGAYCFPGSTRSSNAIRILIHASPGEEFLFYIFGCLDQIKRHLLLVPNGEGDGCRGKEAIGLFFGQLTAWKELSSLVNAADTLRSEVVVHIPLLKEIRVVQSYWKKDCLFFLSSNSTRNTWFIQKKPQGEGFTSWGALIKFEAMYFPHPSCRKNDVHGI